MATATASTLSENNSQAEKVELHRLEECRYNDDRGDQRSQEVRQESWFHPPRALGKTSSTEKDKGFLSWVQ